MRIGVLGGSFDPIHKGHLTLARESQAQFHLDKILFIPAPHPPHKDKNFRLSPAPLRARMVEIAIQGEPNWELSDVELRRPGISYTVDTLRELKKLYPTGTQFFFIAGSDSFQELKDWRDPDEILKLCEWIVAERPEFNLPKKLPDRFHLLKMKPIAASASEIRKRIQEGKDVSQFVPGKVLDYVKRMKLYQEEAS